MKEHDLGAQLRSLVEQTEVLANRKQIALAFAGDDRPVTVWCDPDRLERVFVNLLSNAIKFTPRNGHVTVTLRDQFDDVDVVIEDDGPGFPPDRAEQLFERFYQVDMADRRAHGGTGIGLALARELVVLHGGTIRAESDGSSGARFTVSLPKGRGHLRPEVLAAPRADGATAGVEPGLDWAVQLAARTEFRLLDIEEATERRVVERDTDEEARPYTAVVVEDHPHIVQLVHMSLRRQFKVLTAPDGLKGLELVLRERPSLVVTDLMMPGIDGLALTRRLREEPTTRHIPIIMLTARGELDDRVKGLETGVSAYLTKPFSPKELLTAARELVKANEQTADLVLTQRMESLEMVAAGLAHEINNPLNYLKNALGRVRLDAEKVLGLCGQARERPLDVADQAQVERLSARIHELLGVADSGVKRIGSTVELMSRYGRAGYKREMVPHDAWAAARTVVGIVLPATGRHVKVDLDLEGDGSLECVPEEFGQVLSNLIQNAIEAVPEETGTDPGPRPGRGRHARGLGEGQRAGHPAGGGAEALHPLLLHQGARTGRGARPDHHPARGPEPGGHPPGGRARWGRARSSWSASRARSRVRARSPTARLTAAHDAAMITGCAFPPSPSSSPPPSPACSGNPSPTPPLVGAGGWSWDPAASGAQPLPVLWWGSTDADAPAAPRQRRLRALRIGAGAHRLRRDAPRDRHLGHLHGRGSLDAAGHLVQRQRLGAGTAPRRDPGHGAGRGGGGQEREDRDSRRLRRRGDGTAPFPSPPSGRTASPCCGTRPSCSPPVTTRA